MSEITSEGGTIYKGPDATAKTENYSVRCACGEWYARETGVLLSGKGCSGGLSCPRLRPAQPEMPFTLSGLAYSAADAMADAVADAKAEEAAGRPYGDMEFLGEVEVGAAWQPGEPTIGTQRWLMPQAGEKPDGGGLRYDDGKARYDLIPPEALEALAHHYRLGAAKYADRNWERGMKWGRCFGSLMRHCWAFWRGETHDKETGSHHMIAAAWNCIALFTYDERKIGEDDR